MFPRRSRLSRGQFPTPHTPSDRRTSPHFAVQIPLTGSGYAVVVSKKVARSSVDRHRLKRQVIAALQTLPLPPSLVVYPRVSARGLCFEALQQELASLLTRSRQKSN